MSGQHRRWKFSQRFHFCTKIHKTTHTQTDVCVRERERERERDWLQVVARGRDGVFWWHGLGRDKIICSIFFFVLHVLAKHSYIAIIHTLVCSQVSPQLPSFLHLQRANPHPFCTAGIPPPCLTQSHPPFIYQFTLPASFSFVFFSGLIVHYINFLWQFPYGSFHMALPVYVFIKCKVITLILQLCMKITLARRFESERSASALIAFVMEHRKTSPRVETTGTHVVSHEKNELWYVHAYVSIALFIYQFAI